MQVGHLGCGLQFRTAFAQADRHRTQSSSPDHWRGRLVRNRVGHLPFGLELGPSSALQDLYQTGTPSVHCLRVHCRLGLVDDSASRLEWSPSFAVGSLRNSDIIWALSPGPPALGAHRPSTIRARVESDNSANGSLPNSDIIRTLSPGPPALGAGRPSHVRAQVESIICAAGSWPNSDIICTLCTLSLGPCCVGPRLPSTVWVWLPSIISKLGSGANADIISGSTPGLLGLAHAQAYCPRSHSGWG